MNVLFSNSILGHLIKIIYFKVILTEIKKLKKNFFTHIIINDSSSPVILKVFFMLWLNEPKRENLS